MRSAFLPLLSACLLSFLPACRGGADPVPEWENALRELDRSLSREAVISQAHRADMADLKIQFRHAAGPLARYRLCDRIYDGYLKIPPSGMPDRRKRSPGRREMRNSFSTQRWTCPNAI